MPFAVDAVAKDTPIATVTTTATRLPAVRRTFMRSPGDRPQSFDPGPSQRQTPGADALGGGIGMGPGLRPADLDGLRGASCVCAGIPACRRHRRPTVAGQRRTSTGFPCSGTYGVVGQL